MGADIHAFIEFTNEAPKQTGERYWRPFGSQFRLDRHYGLFAKLADVRNWPEWGIVPVAEQRGLPHDTGYNVDDAYWVYVTENGGDSYYSRAQAERYVAGGHAKWSDDERNWCSNPDWHSATWLTPDEWEKALSDEKITRVPPDYRAFLAAMRSLQQQGYEVRAIFWFDN